MYFKTAKDSETGKKFAEVYNRGIDAWEKRSEFVKKLMERFPTMTGTFKDPGGFVLWGGLYSVMFKEQPDAEQWLPIIGEENEEGREYVPMDEADFKEEFYSLPTVKYPELSACINHYDNKHVIGFIAGKDHFGFEIGPSWGVKVPQDCTEITFTEFSQL